MPRHSPFEIVLTPEEQQQLESVARRYTASYRDVVRAKVILFASHGLRNKEIGRRLDLPRQIVSKWRRRFFERRLAGLEDQPRGGRPPDFSPSGGRRDQSAGL